MPLFNEFSEQGREQSRHCHTPHHAFSEAYEHQNFFPQDNHCGTPSPLPSALDFGNGNDIYGQNNFDCIHPFPLPNVNPIALNEFHQGQGMLGQSGNDLQDALNALNCGNIRGAESELMRSIREMGGGINDLNQGLDLEHRFPNPEEAIRNGIRDVRESRFDARDALRWLQYLDRHPNVCSGERNEIIDHIKDQIRDSLQDNRRGQQEVNYGVQEITNPGHPYFY